MNFVNLDIRILDGEEFLGADPTDRATWICLLKYCGKVENGGRILAGKLWKTRKAEQVLAITREELLRGDGTLWLFDDDDIVVRFYPLDQEEKVRANRRNGRLGGRPRLEEKPHGKPQAQPDAPPRGKRKEREGKEKKGNPPVGPPRGGTAKATTKTPPPPPRVHPDDLDEYGPAPSSEYPQCHPQWEEFLENRDGFERFDAYRTRTEHAAPDQPSRGPN